MNLIGDKRRRCKSESSCPARNDHDDMTTLHANLLVWHTREGEWDGDGHAGRGRKPRRKHDEEVGVS